MSTGDGTRVSPEPAAEILKVSPYLTLSTFLKSAVRQNPDKLFIIPTDGQGVTYGEFDEMVERAAATWIDLDVTRGDRVAFMADNSTSFIVAWFGLAKIGAILVAVNTRFKSEEAGHIIKHSGAELVLVDSQYLDVIRDTDVANLTVLTLDGSGPESFSARAADVDPLTNDIEVSPDDVVSLIYTSGTTGLPKAVMQTHRNYVLTGQSYHSWLRMSEKDRPYICLPLYHINSQAYSVMGALSARATMILAPRFSASRFWDDVRRHEVTMFNFIGAMIMILSDVEPSPLDQQNKVRVAYSGSVASLPLEERAALEERYGLKLLTGFGMSETTFGFIEPYDGERRQASIGVPRGHPDQHVPRSEARVILEDGSDASDGEVGELWLRNATMAKGYFNDPERTAEAFHDGWLRTGDLGYKDGDGYFFFVDRKKDIIRRRGENISSLEIEKMLQSFPAVKEAAVVGVPSPMMDEDVLALVVVRDGASTTAEEIWEWVSERLADFKVPRYVEFVGSLPRTSTQKVSKQELRVLAGSMSAFTHDREHA